MNFLRPRERAQRLLLWCFLVSIAFHFTIGPLIAWLFGSQMTAAQQQQQTIETISLTSSAARLERRPQPRSPSAIQPPAPQPQPRAQPRPVQQERPQAPPPRRELARLNPRADISVPKQSARHAKGSLSFSEQLAQQEAKYTQTIARLRRESNPIVSAARPVSTPAAMKRYAYDFSGNIGTPLAGQGILMPLKDWRDGSWDYYYVRYWVIYPDGTNETGNVPWPIRFPQSLDPIKLGWRRMPLPGPLPDYVLPAGTDLHPFAAYCYEHHYYSCPIAHD